MPSLPWLTESWGGLFGWLKNRIGLGLQMVLYSMQAPLSSERYSITPALWQSWMTALSSKPFTAGRTAGSVHCQTFCLKGKISRCENYKLMYGLVGWLGAWNTHDWKKWWERCAGRGMGVDFSKLQRVGIFVPHVTSCLLQGDLNRGGLQTLSRKDVPFCGQ